MMQAELLQVIRAQPSLPVPSATTPPLAGGIGLRVEAGSARVDFSRPVHAVLGLPFDRIGLEDAAQAVRRAVALRQPCFLSTPNVNFLVGAREHDGFRQSVLHSDLSVVDGMPIVWWARQLGVPITERVAGADLFERLSREEGGPPVRVFFYGGPPGVAEAASAALSQQGGGLVGVGGEAPGFGPIEDIDLDATGRRIEASGADFVLVALGARKGQAWIEAMRHRLEAPVIAHLGAVVNFAARTVRRAPVWTRGIGLEWVWRITQEPALWRRYAADGLALLRLLAREGWPTWRYLRQARAAERPAGRVRLVDAPEGGALSLHLGGDLLDTELRSLREGLSQLARSGRPMRLVVESDAALGTAAMGLLLLLEGFATDARRPLTAHIADPRLARLLALNGLRLVSAAQPA